MRPVLAATGVLAAALLVGVGAYASQAEPASGTSTATTSTGLIGADDSTRTGAAPTPRPSSSATPEVGDDNGGRVDRDLRTEPGDDRDLRVAGDDPDDRYDDHGRGGDDDHDDDPGRGGDDDGPDHD